MISTSRSGAKVPGSRCACVRAGCAGCRVQARMQVVGVRTEHCPLPKLTSRVPEQPRQNPDLERARFLSCHVYCTPTLPSANLAAHLSCPAAQILAAGGTRQIFPNSYPVSPCTCVYTMIRNLPRNWTGQGVLEGRQVDLQVRGKQGVHGTMEGFRISRGRVRGWRPRAQGPPRRPAPTLTHCSLACGRPVTWPTISSRCISRRAAVSTRRTAPVSVQPAQGLPPV